MHYLGPRKRSKDGRYDFTTKQDSSVYPVGYCAGWHEITPDEAKRWSFSEEELKRMQATKEQYHLDGHATPEEACSCYTRYLLDSHLKMGLSHGAQQQKCVICEQWSQQYAELDMNIITLCPEHMKREVVEVYWQKKSSKVYSIAKS